MINVITTIPKSKFKTWAECERILQACDGETIYKGHKTPWFWLINTANLPTKSGIGGLVYMVYDGRIRGYMDWVETGNSEEWRRFHAIGKRRTTHCIVMANWHPVAGLPDMTGFQGWRYTQLRPL